MRRIAKKWIWCGILACMAFANGLNAAPILLRHGSFDPATSSSSKVQSATLATKEASVPARGLYLIQHEGTITPDWRNKLECAGAIIRRYIPENAYLVEVAAEAYAAVSAIEHSYFGEFKGVYKVDLPVSTVQTMAKDVQGKGTSADVMSVCIVSLFDRDTREIVVKRLTELDGAEVISSVGKAIRVKLTAEGIRIVSEWVEVESIGPYLESKLHNNIAVQAPRMNVEAVWPNGETGLGLTGEGQVVAVADTGLDTGDPETVHDDVRDRIIRAYARGRVNDWSDPNGHGTHVAGSVLGNGNKSSSPSIRGVAYKASLIFQSTMDDKGALGGIPDDLNDLFDQAYAAENGKAGARIHSNSWGAGRDNGSWVLGYYSDMSKAIDEFMFGHPDMCIIWSAGNDGVDNAPENGVIDGDSISTQSTAKNCITVGASENYRTTGGYAKKYWSVGSWAADFPKDPIAKDYISRPYQDDKQGMAAFSSRGPCDDGRIKPDIVAPGTDILSIRSSCAAQPLWAWDDSTLSYQYSGGTSMSTPLVSGSAALVRQWLVQKRNIPNPDGATIKAMLLAGAKSLAPGQYGNGSYREIPSTYPNNVEGWGQVNLGNTVANDQGVEVYDGQIIAHGETQIFRAHVETAGRPITVVMAYTDAPGSVAATKELVNDLDLTVETPSGSVMYPNSRTSADNVNNVEGVRIASAEKGTYTITIKARSIATPMSMDWTQGKADATRYSLVVNGAEEGYGTSEITVDAKGGNKSEEVNANLSWTVSVDVEWIKLSSTEFDGPGDYAFFVEKNYLAEDRSGVITMTSGAYEKTIIVKQSGRTLVIVNSGSITIDTSATPPTFTIAGGKKYYGTTLDGVAVFHFDYLEIGPSVSVSISGTRPLALESETDMKVGAKLDVSGAVAGRCGGGVGGKGGDGGISGGGGVAGAGGDGGNGGAGMRKSPSITPAVIGSSGQSGSLGNFGSLGGDGKSGSAATAAFGSTVVAAGGAAASGGSSGGRSSNVGSGGSWGAVDKAGGDGGSGSAGGVGGAGTKGNPGGNGKNNIAWTTAYSLVGGAAGGGGSGGGAGGGGGSGSGGGGGGGGGGDSTTPTGSGSAKTAYDRGQWQGAYGGHGGKGGAGGKGGLGGVGGKGGTGANGGGAIALAAVGVLQFYGTVDLSAGNPEIASNGEGGGLPGSAGSGAEGTLTEQGALNTGSVSPISGFYGGKGGHGGAGGAGGKGGDGAAGGAGGFGAPGMLRLQAGTILCGEGKIVASNGNGDTSVDRLGSVVYLTRMPVSALDGNCLTCENGLTVKNDVVNGGLVPSVYDASVSVPLVGQLKKSYAEVSGICAEGNFALSLAQSLPAEGVTEGGLTVKRVLTLYDGYDQVFFINESGQTVPAGTVVIGGESVAIPELAAGEAWTTCVAPGASVVVETVTASAEITAATISPRWPWNGKVDIDYTIDIAPAGASVIINVTGFDEDRQRTLVAKTLSGVKVPTASGSYRLTWDVVADYPNFNAASFKVGIEASVSVPLKVAQYIVIDVSGGPNAATFPVIGFSDIPAGGWTDEYKTEKIVLRRIPAGTFMMGSPENEQGRDDDEPQHAVALTHDYFLGVFEITQRQWELVTGAAGFYFTNKTCSATRPAEQIAYVQIRGSSKQLPNGVGSIIDCEDDNTWPITSQVAAKSFMGILRSKTGLGTLDLPTEAEWEYACRGGTVTPFNCGQALYLSSGVYLARFNWGSPDRNSGVDKGTAPVGSYPPNGWGLYDMHGNVNEWCLDWYEESLGTDAVQDPVGTKKPTNPYRVVRGGGSSWESTCRSASRTRQNIADLNRDYGFRLCLSMKSIVQLDDGEGTGGSGSVLAFCGVMMPSVIVPTRKGYSFGGYYDDVKAKGVQYYNESGHGVCMMNNVELPWLYAKWIPKTYAITFDKQGGTGGADSTTATFDSLMPDVAYPAKKGYDFAGYFTQPNGQGVQYYGSGLFLKSCDLTEPIKLYAYWTPITYEVVFHSNGGSGSMSNQVLTYDTAAYLKKNSFLKDGYAFSGWATSENGSVAYTDGQQVMNLPIARESFAGRYVDLYAKWTSTGYTITFDMQGGSGGTPSLSSVSYGSTMSNITVPKRSGYTFCGYFSSTGGSGTQYFNSSGVAQRTWDQQKDATLYAYWQGNAVRLLFDKQDGIGGDDAIIVRYGSTVTSVSVPTRAGYKFGGYYTGTSGSGTQYYSSTGAGVEICYLTAQTTLYAYWIQYMVIDLSGGTSASSYGVSYLSAPPIGGWTDTYKTTRLVLRYIDPGTFTMGSRSTDHSEAKDNGVHQVSLTKGYWMGVFEVTQRQWELVMGTKPSKYYNTSYYTTRPVENVNYDTIRGSSLGAQWPASSSVDSTSFFGVLRKKAGLSKLDLPTEAEWEYACRAGTTTALNSGKNLSSGYGACTEMNEVARYFGNWTSLAGDGWGVTTTKGTNKVGGYLPNAWGLYDMHGNVQEWCLDWYGPRGVTAVSDPVGATKESSAAMFRDGAARRIAKGGSCHESGAYCCSGTYNYWIPNETVNGAYYGLRIALRP